MNFKSKAAYNAWLAYGHASGEFAKTPGNQPVSIKGKSHGVQHKKGGKSRRGSRRTRRTRRGTRRQ